MANQRQRYSQRRHSAAGPVSALRRNGDLVIALVLIVAVNSLLYAAMRPKFQQERKYLEVLRDVRVEVELLRERGASPEEWREFRARVETDIRPIVAELERTAGVDRPIRQHLLWASRDNLPELFTGGGLPVPSKRKRSEDEVRFDEHLRWVEQALSEANR